MSAQLSTDLRHVMIGAGRQQAASGSVGTGEGDVLAEPGHFMPVDPRTTWTRVRPPAVTTLIGDASGALAVMPKRSSLGCPTHCQKAMASSTS